MAHKHNIYDTDNHYTINASTRAITNVSPTKVLVMQYDHNSERLTFEMPRYVEEHDMSLCDKVEVHYLNSDGKNKAVGVYTVDDLQLSPDDENIIICSWVISHNATWYSGNLDFLLRFVCLSGEEIDYAWNTDIYTNLKVSNGIYNSDKIVEQHIDALEQWRDELLRAAENGARTSKGVKNVEIRTSSTSSGLIHSLWITLEDGTYFKTDFPAFVTASDMVVVHDFDPTDTHTGDVDIEPKPGQAPTMGGWLAPNIGRIWVNTVNRRVFILMENNYNDSSKPRFVWTPIDSLPGINSGDEGKTLRVKNGNAVWGMSFNNTDNPDIHASYFTITRDGILALKPEYRGANTRTGYPYADSDNGSGVAGSKNAELPELLIIPETVNGTAVNRLADGIFLSNHAVKDATFPSCVEDIPERCFDNCFNLHNLYNTDHVKSVGKTAFQSTSIHRVKFPNLETLGGVSAFQNCGRLIYADIGGVTTLPDKTFNLCASLSRVKSRQKITSVGEKCFSLDGNLVNLDFVSGLTSIGDMAFLGSRFDYDWSSLTSCTFGTDATQKQFNPTDYWNACTYTPCKNPLPTLLTQDNPLWADREIGSSGVNYDYGCGFMTIMSAYCGLHNISVTSIEELEDIINTRYPGHINTYSAAVNASDEFARGLGLTAETYTTIDQSILQTLYNSIAAGKYAQVSVTGVSLSLSHAVLIYGVNEYGEFLVMDTQARFRDDFTVPSFYAIPFKNLCAYTYKNTELLKIISL